MNQYDFSTYAYTQFVRNRAAYEWTGCGCDQWGATLDRLSAIASSLLGPPNCWVTHY